MKSANFLVLSHSLLRAGRWLFALAAVCASATTAAAGNTLESVDAVAAGGNRVTIRLKLAHAAPVPSVFTVDNPARLAIDLADTKPGGAKRYQRIDQGPVQAVATAAGHARTRVVVELDKMVAYDIQRQGQQILVHLGGESASTRAAARLGPKRPGAAPAAPERPAPASDNRASARATAAVADIDFRRAAKGAGRIDIALDGGNTQVNVTKHNGRVIAELPHATLPDRLQERLDVTDFATPVKTIDALASAGATRVVVTPRPGVDYEQIAYQTGSHFYIELQPVSAAQRKISKPRYTGKKISLSFQNVDVGKILQIIADVAKVNLVVADSVSGKMALRLQDVPWDQALDIIMKAKGLGMQRNDNVITVAPLTEIAARKKAELAAQQATESLTPLKSEIIQINYARASDIAALLRSGGARQSGKGAAPAGAGASGVSLLSGRGKITVDDRTNSLLISDTASSLAAIRKVINRLDIAVRQVQIQSRIVVANRDFTRNLGITQTGVDNSRLNNALAGGNAAFDANNGGFRVSLPSAQATSILSTSIITDTFSLNLQLSAMESENRAEVISSPRVITADGQEANIEQGTQIPYQQGSAGSLTGVSVEFKKAVLSLDATPKITPNNKVQMTLKVTQDSVGQFVPTLNGGSVPSINTRGLTTQVLVNDGDTVVLGGVFEQTHRNAVNGVPVLKDIPLIGALFRSTQRQKNKQELLIFVTPKILHTGLAGRL